MFGFWLVVLAVTVALKRRHPKREFRLLYKQGELVGDTALFPCGCRYNWTKPAQEPSLCAAHRAIVSAEVNA